TNTLTIAYVNGGSPSPVEVSVNGRRRMVSFPSTGGGVVDALGTVRLEVRLSEGRDNEVSVGIGPGEILALDSITVQAGSPAAATTTGSPAAPAAPDPAAQDRPAS